MGTFERFEDIVAWQKARELTRKAYALSNQPPFSRDFGLRDQIRRASVSVVSNIAEGFERSGTGEFVQFLSQAKGSAGEVRAQLYTAFDLGYLPKENFDELLKLANVTSRMIGGLMNYLRVAQIKGTKFKRFKT